MRARWYNPTTGTFTSRDPFPGVDTVPQSLHPYAYTHNNPVNWTDPSGKCIPGLSPDCTPVWEIGQGLNWQDFGSYWSDIGTTIKDTVVGTAQMLYDVATREEARAQVARGAYHMYYHPRSAAGMVLEAAATPFTDIYQGIVCGDANQLGRGLTGFGFMLGGARLARVSRSPIHSTSVSIQRVGGQAALEIPRRLWFQTLGVPQLKPGRLIKEMSRSQIGSYILKAARDDIIDLSLSFERVDRTLMGQSFGRHAEVYVRNTQSYQHTAQVLIHEGMHSFGIRGSRRAEALVRLAEVVHQGGSIDRAAMRAILRDMRQFPEDYGHLPWRIHRTSPHFPGLGF
jgi:hypothetical protein